MADDWDLFAVVRSCTNSFTSTATTSASASAAAATTTTTKCSNPARTGPVVNLQEEEEEEEEGDHHPFYFPGVTDEREDSFQGLHEIYKELYLESAVAPAPAPREEFRNNQTNIINEQQEKNNQHHLPIRHGIHILASSSAPINNNNSFSSTNNNFLQSGRPRRRKNQQGKVSHHMSQEELSSDSWAWRKYGQKPIKGSPYPRNYYRCSTSKGCSARKQVERSPTDPDIFVVSYSGEHTHPRPTHRSSLAGSTRTKLSNSPSTKAPPTTTMTNTTTTTTNTSSSSSSPVVISATCLHQNVDDDDENPTEIATTSSGNIVEEDDDDDEEDEEEDILIPNNFITHDILKGFQELS